jgi:hypothetical protein
MEIDIATIEKGSDYLGMVASIKPEDQFTRWRSEFEADILVSLASLAGERMFFDSDSSSGVSGDLDSATTVAALMEGYWGMGKTVSSASSARRLEAGTPGGTQRAAVPGASQDPHGSPAFARLADRIEENLGVLLVRAEEILRDNERDVLALAHALETHKTLSGEDVAAVLAGGHGPLVDGSVYADDAFIARLRDYHLAAKRAHQEHGQPQIPMPTPAPAYVVTIPESYLTGNGIGAGNGTGTEAGEVIDFGGFGTGNPLGNGSHTGPLGAPTYDPPGLNGPDDQEEDDHP